MGYYLRNNPTSKTLRMDDATLAAQYAQTGDLMDLCSTEAWLQESARLEDAVEGQAEAGAAMRDYTRAVQALTPEQAQNLRQQMRIQSILFTGLRRWMESWDLGASFEDTYTLARRLVRAHLAQPHPTQQTFLDRLLAEDSGLAGSTPAQQQQAIFFLSEIFTPDDWQALAVAASQSMSSQVLRAGQREIEVA